MTGFYTHNRSRLHSSESETNVEMESKPEHSTGQIKHIETPSPNITTWATHQFRFSATPLRQVLSDLSAYYGVDLDCAAEGKRLTATFRADNLSDIVSMIEETLNVTIKIRQ